MPFSRPCQPFQMMLPLHLRRDFTGKYLTPETVRNANEGRDICSNWLSGWTFNRKRKRKGEIQDFHIKGSSATQERTNVTFPSHPAWARKSHAVTLCLGHTSATGSGKH